MSISVEKLKILSSLRVKVGWLFFILVAMIGQITFVWPILLILIGEGIRTIAAGTIRKNETLATKGIYEIVRHPLYLGSFMIGAGFCLTCNNIFLWIYILIFFPLCYIPAIILEEKHLEYKFGQKFTQYKKSVPAFIPLKLRTKEILKDFSWTIVFKNYEQYNWFAIIALLIVLQFKIFFIH